ncbi:MAG: alpha/beta hydrolase [Chitinispirillales bacterium]|nr:alpha/beta hydrolase [Chitinispirillales bacterium]
MNLSKNKTTLVFGGWAVKPQVLEPVFGKDACYIDVNEIMPKLFDSRLLKKDWVKIVLSECRLTGNNIPHTIAGWSTGAMFAYSIARLSCPKKLILFSATSRFCRKDEYRFGVRESALDQMISALSHDSQNVLESFYKRCGLRYDSEVISRYTPEQLSHGLMFLKQTDLRPLAPLGTKPLFFHGCDDKIIPKEASVYFSSQTGGTHTAFSGGHTFFTEHHEEIVKILSIV